VPRYNKCLNNGGEYVENSLKNIDSDNNKILYEILINFFLQRNSTYFLNKPCIYKLVILTVKYKIVTSVHDYEQFNFNI